MLNPPTNEHLRADPGIGKGRKTLEMVRDNYFQLE